MSVDGQDAHAAGATAGATDIGGIAGWSLHCDVEVSGGRDHRGRNSARELGAAGYGSGDGGAIEDHYRRGNELAALRGQYKTGRQL